MKNLSAIPIRTPYIDDILSGIKTWEFRSRKTKKLGPVGLIRSGSGTVVGTAKIIMVIDLSSESEIEDAARRGLAVYEAIYDDGYAWVLADVVKFENPVPYKHPSGAVTWVTLDEPTTAKVMEEARLSSPLGNNPDGDLLIKHII